MRRNLVLVTLLQQHQRMSRQSMGWYITDNRIDVHEWCAMISFGAIYYFLITYPLESPHYSYPLYCASGLSPHLISSDELSIMRSSEVQPEQHAPIYFLSRRGDQPPSASELYLLCIYLCPTLSSLPVLSYMPEIDKLNNSSSSSPYHSHSVMTHNYVKEARKGCSLACWNPNLTCTTHSFREAVSLST
jgi:hypothetical protein